MTAGKGYCEKHNLNKAFIESFFNFLIIVNLVLENNEKSYGPEFGRQKRKKKCLVWNLSETKRDNESLVADNYIGF